MQLPNFLGALVAALWLVILGESTEQVYNRATVCIFRGACIAGTLVELYRVRRQVEDGALLRQEVLQQPPRLPLHRRGLCLHLCRRRLSQP